MALAELDFKLNVNLTATAKLAAESALLKAAPFKVEASPAFTVAKAIANAAAGGGDALFADIVEVPVGSPVTIDLKAFADISGTAAQLLSRAKVFFAQLLRVADDPTAGNACSGCEIAVGAMNGWTGFLKAAGDALVLQPGQVNAIATPSAGGWAVDATHKTLTLTNTDGAVPARVLLVVAGGSS